MLDLEFAQASDAGRVREGNEDYLGRAEADGWLFALADGVGGQDLGEVASRTAVETLLAEFQLAGNGEPLRTLLPRLVQDTNARVYEAGLNARPGGVAMATTLVACGLRFDRAVVCHAGDSRCYLIRGGKATALTRDHTQGEGSNVLTRSLGQRMFISADTAEHLLTEGDVLLLCSDGLHRAVSGAEMAEMVEGDLEAAARDLVAAANERDGSDNISVQLVRVKAVERVGIYRGRPYRLG